MARPADSDYLTHAAVTRVRQSLLAHGHADTIEVLADSARTAAQAAQALGCDVGQIASSIVFSADSDAGLTPVLVVTSGRHRVDTDRVAASLGLPALHRVDADFVRLWSDFAIGGVSPVGWMSVHDLSVLRTVVDVALAEYPRCWAAAGHPHTVFATTHADLVRMTGGISCDVGD